MPADEIEQHPSDGWSVISLETGQAFEAWLDIHHADKPGVWVKFAKKGTRETHPIDRRPVARAQLGKLTDGRSAAVARDRRPSRCLRIIRKSTTSKTSENGTPNARGRMSQQERPNPLVAENNLLDGPPVQIEQGNHVDGELNDHHAQGHESPDRNPGRDRVHRLHHRPPPAQGSMRMPRSG